MATRFSQPPSILTRAMAAVSAAESSRESVTDTPSGPQAASLRQSTKAMRASSSRTRSGVIPVRRERSAMAAVIASVTSRRRNSRQPLLWALLRR